MDLELLIAQWSGQLPPGFLLPAERPEARPECSHKRCHRPVAIKRNGEFAKACQRCLDRALGDEEGSPATYRKRAEGDFLCARCREDRDVERAQKRRDAIDAAAIDEFAARPETAHRTSNLGCGLSPLMPRGW